MNFDAVIASIVTSGIISAAFALYTSVKLKKVEFTYNYKEYILNKRKTAYERIEFIISDMAKVFDKGMGSEMAFHWDIELSKKMLQNISDAIEENIWFSQTLKILLRDAHYIFRELTISVENNKDMKRSVRVEKVDEIYKKLRIAYFSDLMSLDDIKKFKKESMDKNASIINFYDRFPTPTHGL